MLFPLHLADVNVGLGLYIFTYGFSEFRTSGAPIWLYVAYTVFIMFFFVICYPCLVHCAVLKRKVKRRKTPEEIELTEKGSEGADEEAQLPVMFSMWISLGVFSGTTIIVVVVLTIFISL